MKEATGFVPSSANTNVMLKIGDKTYTTKTDKNGEFVFTFNDQLYAGQALVVVAYDVKNGKEDIATEEVIVQDIESYVNNNSVNLILDGVSNKTNAITGYYYSGGNVNIAITTGVEVTLRVVYIEYQLIMILSFSMSLMNILN